MTKGIFITVLNISLSLIVEVSIMCICFFSSDLVPTYDHSLPFFVQACSFCLMPPLFKKASAMKMATKPTTEFFKNFMGNAPRLLNAIFLYVYARSYIFTNMEKIIKNILPAVTLFCLLPLSSCYVSPHRVYMPTEAFGMIRHSMLLKICHGDQCAIKTSASTSSGAFFARSRSNPDYGFFLTAGHSCAKPKIPKNLKDEMKITILTSAITVVDENLNKMSTEVIRIDSKNDLCVLKVLLHPDANLKYLDIAEDPPARGERVYNMAAPYGYFGRKTVMLFEGFYSGRPGIHEAVFSIPTRPGSSGSPILNSSMQIVGVIYAGVDKLENLSIASPHDSIRAIVDSVIEEDRDVYKLCMFNKCFVFYRR